MGGGVALGVGEGEAVRDGLPQGRQDVGPDVGIGVFIDGDAGRRVGDEDDAKAVLDSGRGDDPLDLGGQVNDLLPGARCGSRAFS